LEAFGRLGVWAFGRLGVWAFGRLGVKLMRRRVLGHNLFVFMISFFSFPRGVGS